MVMFEFYICDSQLKLRDFWHGWVLAVLYCTVNYYYTQVAPEPVYPFLLWENPLKDILSCALCTIFGTLLMCLSGYIQETIMARRFWSSW